MTTMESAFALFMVMLTMGMTMASLWRCLVTRPNTGREILHAVQLHAVQQRALAEQSKLRRADLAWDYCAGHDGVVLRMAMRWTADGEWRCRECAPPTEDELAEELAAAGAALATRFQTLAEAKSEIRRRGSGTITRHITTYGEHYTVDPPPFSNAYADQNAKPVAYGITDDGEWSLWANMRQAQFYAQRTTNRHCEVFAEGPYWRVETHPLGWTAADHG